MELLGLNTTIKVILLDELENLELAIMFDISLPKCNKKQLILNQNGHNNQGRKSTLYLIRSSRGTTDTSMFSSTSTIRIYSH